MHCPDQQRQGKEKRRSATAWGSVEVICKGKAWRSYETRYDAKQ